MSFTLISKPYVNTNFPITPYSHSSTRPELGYHQFPLSCIHFSCQITYIFTKSTNMYCTPSRLQVCCPALMYFHSVVDWIFPCLLKFICWDPNIQWAWLKWLINYDEPPSCEFRMKFTKIPTRKHGILYKQIRVLVSS